MVVSLCVWTGVNQGMWIVSDGVWMVCGWQVDGSRWHPGDVWVACGWCVVMCWWHVDGVRVTCG